MGDKSTKVIRVDKRFAKLLELLRIMLDEDSIADVTRRIIEKPDIILLAKVADEKIRRIVG